MLSELIHKQIVDLWNQGVLPSNISQQLRVSRSTVRRNLIRWRETGKIDLRCKGTPEVVTKITEYKREKPTMFGSQIRDRLVAEKVCSADRVPSVDAIFQIVKRIKNHQLNEQTNTSSPMLQNNALQIWNRTAEDGTVDQTVNARTTVLPRPAVVPEDTTPRVRRSKRARTSLFLHEQDSDIVVPEDTTSGVRRSKRVRTSRPLGYGEKLIYSATDKAGVRTLLGGQRNNDIVSVDESSSVVTPSLDNGQLQEELENARLEIEDEEADDNKNQTKLTANDGAQSTIMAANEEDNAGKGEMLTTTQRPQRVQTPPGGGSLRTSVFDLLDTDEPPIAHSSPSVNYTTEDTLNREPEESEAAASLGNPGPQHVLLTPDAFTSSLRKPEDLMSVDSSFTHVTPFTIDQPSIFGSERDKSLQAAETSKSSRKETKRAAETSKSSRKDTKRGGKSKKQPTEKSRGNCRQDEEESTLVASDNEHTLVEESPKKKNNITVSRNTKTAGRHQSDDRLLRHEEQVFSCFTDDRLHRHEQVLDIIVPEDTASGVRKGKRVRTSRPLGYGEKLIYSATDKAGVRTLLGVELNNVRILLNMERFQGGTIHIEPMVSDQRKRYMIQKKSRKNDAENNAAKLVTSKAPPTASYHRVSVMEKHTREAMSELRDTATNLHSKVTTSIKQEVKKLFGIEMKRAQENMLREMSKTFKPQHDAAIKEQKAVVTDCIHTAMAAMQQQQHRGAN